MCHGDLTLVSGPNYSGTSTAAGSPRVKAFTNLSSRPASSELVARIEGRRERPRKTRSRFRGDTHLPVYLDEYVFRHNRNRERRERRAVDLGGEGRAALEPEGHRVRRGAGGEAQRDQRQADRPGVGEHVS